MALYEELGKVNVLRVLKKAGVGLEPDGRVKATYRMSVDHPWIENGICPKRNCLCWLDLYFKYFKLIPSGCRDCWKSFYFPETLEELMEIHKFQQTESRKHVDIPCKAGIERRFYTGRRGGYAAFWYNPLGCGLEQARENTRKLSQVLGVPVLLKRGCTEMEQHSLLNLGFGSDEWYRLATPHNQLLEELLGETFYTEGKRPLATPPILRTEVLQLWIEWAAEHGDKTYLKYTEGPFYPKLVMYKGSTHRNEDFPNREQLYVKDYNQPEQATVDTKSRDEKLVQGLDQM